MDPLSQVFHYHEETKHHFFRYARALGYLDWANQPDPCRRFAGAPLLPLPILTPEQQPASPPYDALFLAGAVAPEPVTIRSLSRFFEYALALSAWKQAGDVRWALRVNPSSGNLHPTEGYLLIGGVPGLASTPGLYHYAAKEHALERRADCCAEAYAALMKEFPPGAFLFGLASVHWREAWKYGERAFRYCQHDVGHAIGTARMAAATLGWNLVLLECLGDDAVAALLGVNRTEDFAGAESEHPDCIAVVWPNQTAKGYKLPLFLDAGAMDELSRNRWHGRANRLSRDGPVSWDIIDAVAAASWKPPNTGQYIEVSHEEYHSKGSTHNVSSGFVIKSRRSAVAFDGKTTITKATFFGMLQRVLPGEALAMTARPAPWDAIPWEPRIHLAIFAHLLVEDLCPGLYMMVRDPAKVGALRQATHAHFLWRPLPVCPPELPLFLLEEGDARRLAAQVSCHQAIAGDSAFSLGMIAEYEDALRTHGPWFYRRLFWEAGLIGQVLYLEAEAAGVRATGIGCYFDDPVHEVFGFKGRAFQSLYHFTVGGPVEDPRLTTLPPYGISDGTPNGD